MARILLVEDDPLVYRLYQRMLGLEGHEVELAHNGLDGLNKLRAFKPDCILLDIMMPSMNGIEMLTKLKADPDTENIPVVILTNVSDMRVSTEVLNKGANLIIAKSEAEPDQVLAWIKSVVDKSKEQDRNDSDEHAAKE